MYDCITLTASRSSCSPPRSSAHRLHPTRSPIAIYPIFIFLIVPHPTVLRRSIGLDLCRRHGSSLAYADISLLSYYRSIPLLPFPFFSHSPVSTCSPPFPDSLMLCIMCKLTPLIAAGKKRRWPGSPAVVDRKVSACQRKVIPMRRV